MSIPGGRSGQGKTWEPGRWQRASIRKAKIRCMLHCVNSLKKQAIGLRDHSCPWGRESSQVENKSSHGLPKATGTLPAWSQIHSAWNGPGVREQSGNFPRWIAPNGSIWRKRSAAFFPGSGVSSMTCVESSWWKSFIFQEWTHEYLGSPASATEMKGVRIHAMNNP